MSSKSTVSRSVILILSLAASTSAIRGLEDPTFKALREGRPDGRHVEVRDLEIERDVLRFHFESGVFHFVQGVGDETVSAVFVGQGSFLLQPASDNERRHLSMLLGEDDFEVLSDTFTDLVLHFTDGTFAEIAAAGAIQEGEPDPKALKAFEKYFKRWAGSSTSGSTAWTFRAIAPAWK